MTFFTVIDFMVTGYTVPVILPPMVPTLGLPQRAVLRSGTLIHSAPLSIAKNLPHKLIIISNKNLRLTLTILTYKVIGKEDKTEKVAKMRRMIGQGEKGKK
jgi:hypothetical protein